MKPLGLTLVASLALAGCAAGGSADCAAMQAQAKGAIDNNKTCAQDGDCVVVTSACALPGDCGVALNAAGASRLLTISNGWNNGCQQGASGCPHCPSPPSGAICVGGVCKCAGGCVGDSE